MIKGSVKKTSEKTSIAHFVSKIIKRCARTTAHDLYVGVVPEGTKKKDEEFGGKNSLE